MSLQQTPASDKPSAGSVRSSPAHGRRHVLRRSTVNPLDSEDPLSAQAPTVQAPAIQAPPAQSPPVQAPVTQQSPPQTPPRQSLIPERKHVASPLRSESRSPNPPVTVVERPKKDFGFLLRRDHFHALGDNAIPQPFRDSPSAPKRGSTIQQLLSNGHFRAAAILAAEQLTTQTAVTDHAAIFSLLFTRLACLQLCGLHDIAAQESKALQDINAPFYTDRDTGKNIIPWDLRVLAVRLQALGFGDWRRGVMGYYELAREARIEHSRSSAAIAEPDAQQQQKLWKERLQDLGVRVGNALLEMGDDEGAVRHLRTLERPEDGSSPVSKTQLALVHLRAGDVAAARRCIQTETGIGGDSSEDSSASTPAVRTVEALCKMADGAFEDAIPEWRALRESSSGDDDATSETAQIATQNLAVCLVFTGDIQQARAILEDQVGHEGGQVLEERGEEASITRATTFTLATIYELCSDGSGRRKAELAARVASRAPASTGWEMSNADFKL